MEGLFSCFSLVWTLVCCRSQRLKLGLDLVLNAGLGKDLRSVSVLG